MSLSSPPFPPAIGIAPNGDASYSTRTCRILLMGKSRSGKSSARETIFNNMAPKQTLYLESTPRITRKTYKSVVPIEIWECPSNTTIDQLGVELSEFTSLVYFLDVQDTYQNVVSAFSNLVMQCQPRNPNMYFELLVHKKEALPEDYQHDLMRIINERLAIEVEEFFQQGHTDVQMDDIVRVHATSIYDHSLWQAFSLIIQRGIEETYQLGQCVDTFKANSAFGKVFLFDIATRLYLATDSLDALDVEDYALAWDYVNTLRQMWPLYEPKSKPESSASSIERSHSVSRLWSNNSSTATILAYWQINDLLGVVAIMPADTYDKSVAAIDFNLVHFREGLKDVLDLLSHLHSDTGSL